MAYSKIYYPPTTNGLQKTLDAALDEGHTTAMTLSNVTGIQDKPGVVVINRIDSDSTELSSSVREYVSYTNVSGSTLTGLTRGLGGTTDQDHAVGSVVEFIPDITLFQALIDAFLVEHKEADAKHGAITATSLASAGAISGTTITGSGLVRAQAGLRIDTQAYFDAEVDDGNSSTADTIDWTTGNKHKSTVTGDCTYTFTSPTGPANLILKLVNGGAHTPVWPGTVLWVGGSEPSWTASGTDIVAFYWDGTNYYGQASLDFS